MRERGLHQASAILALRESLKAFGIVQPQITITVSRAEMDEILADEVMRKLLDRQIQGYSALGVLYTVKEKSDESE